MVRQVTYFRQSRHECVVEQVFMMLPWHGIPPEVLYPRGSDSILRRGGGRSASADRSVWVFFLSVVDTMIDRFPVLIN